MVNSPTEKGGDLVVRKRTKNMFIKLTEQEKDTLNQKAREAGMSISEYVRTMSLKEKEVANERKGI